ncbi:MAG: lyase family protein, partial [Kiritimatiellae bacterium]|nr:lyase family protein [Kiritimatiellia bacterium]
MAYLDMLCAVSPLDGRYGSKVEELRDVFSEYGLVKRRVAVECAWLAALCASPELPECPALTADEAKALQAIADGFSVADAQRVKDIEKTTNHDVKAVEYFIKEKIKGTSLEGRGEFVHFSCTSEDINNMSHALMLRDGLKALRAAQNEVTDAIAAMAHAFAAVPMLAHTHGQPASPTTLGKELAVVAARLRRQQDEIDRIVLPAK